jgi:hypothetical protein
MALDVYVMPLSRYKDGDFRSPIEAVTAIRPKIVTGDGIVERLTPVSWFRRFKARRQVAAVRKAVERVNHTRVRWADDGGVVYAEQSGGFESLRVYAKWLDCRDRFPEFQRPPDGNYYNHPVFALEGIQLSTPHLVRHDCYCGYFLPCDFVQMVEVEPYLIFNRWPAKRWVGSASRLQRELALVQAELKVPDQYDYPQDDPLVAVKAAYLQLWKVAELSCQHRLPIIFWG